MRINVTFRHMDPSDTLREYAETRLKKLKKYSDGPMEVNVVLSVEKFRHTAEVVTSGDGVNAAAKEQQNDMYSAIDLVSDKVEKQLKRYREKIKNRRSPGPAPEEEAIKASPPAEAPELGTTRTIRTEKMDVKPMSVDEAVAQLRVTEQDFMVFTNAENSTVNVLYWRKDGTLGLIEP